MRRLTAVATASALSALWGVLVAQSPSRLVFVNAQLADVATGRVRPVAAVVVEGGRIAAVHAKAPTPAPEGRTVDAGGATLVPGLADLAVQAYPGMDLDADFYYALSLAHGVMRIRTVDVRLPWAVEQVRRARSEGRLLPLLSTSGPALDMRTPLGARNQPLLGGGTTPLVQAADPATISREVARQAKVGVDWVRLREHVPPEATRAAVTSARAAKVRVSVSAVATSMAQAGQLGAALIDGLGSPTRPYAELEKAWKSKPDPPSTLAAGIEVAWAQLTPQELRTLVAQLVRTRTAVAPLLVTLDAQRGALPAVDRDLAFVPERLRVAIQARTAAAALAKSDVRERARAQQLAFVRDFVKAGGRLAAASGSTAEGWPLPGLGLHRELELMVEAGLTPADALRAATTTGTPLVTGRELTTWRAGAPADFFGVQGDPFSDLSALASITLLVRNGEVLDRAQLLRQVRPRGR